MARWVCTGQPQHILDPALGQGVFIDAIDLHLVCQPTIAASVIVDACEIDEPLLRQFKREHRRPTVRCRRADFVTTRFRRKYDAVIANPPYVRHHAMRYDDATLRRFDRICGRRLSRMTNLYGLFLIKIWTLLAARGRAAVITPAEWLNADFGAGIKAYLLEQNAIDAIVHFDHAAEVFEGTLTTAAITLLRRDRGRDELIRLCKVDNADALRATTVERGKPVLPGRLDPNAKWTPLFDGNADATGKTKPSASRHTLGEIVRCNRGIATGANDYFALRPSERQHWGIDPRDLRVCVTKAWQIPGDGLTDADVQRLIDEDQRIYLLHPRGRLTAAVKRYLKEGVRRGIDKRYLPSHRPVWYVPEHREPAPLLVSVFARGRFRFALNKAGVLNLTAFHGIYPLVSGRSCIKAIFEYVSSAQARSALRSCRRIYADGLLKL
ncbi:MAG: N-6 DNA methylase, partial [Planctomycetota bacterium]